MRHTCPADVLQVQFGALQPHDMLLDILLTLLDASPRLLPPLTAHAWLHAGTGALGQQAGQHCQRS